MTSSFKTFLYAVGALVVVGWFFGVVMNDSSANGGRGRGGMSLLPRKHLRLSYGFSEGWLISHDFYLTNNSGEDLSEVNLHITFVGENGSPSVDRYWSAWPLGAKQHVEIPVERVSNVQRIDVAGRAVEGDIEETLVPKGE